MEVKAKMNEDILTLAQRRRAARVTSRNGLDPRSGLSGYPSERILRIDNYTTGPEIPSPAPSPVPYAISTPYEFSEVSKAAGRERTRKIPMKSNANPMFVADPPSYSRNLLPPLVNVEIQGQEIPALVNTSSHISLISTRLVNILGLRRELIPDKTVPASPLESSQTIHYLVEGKIHYVELSLRGSKHVTQLYVARDLPTDLILGVDFLKKAQVKINFQESSISIPSGKEEIKISFLSNKELQQQCQQSKIGNMDTPHNRAYSSNF